MKYVTKNASYELNELLCLPATGEEQDWDLELSNGDRLEEFISTFSANDFSKETRFALCSLIVASFEEFLIGNRTELERESLSKVTNHQYSQKQIAKIYSKAELDVWEKISSIIQSDMGLYDGIIVNWGQYDEYDDGDANTVTLLFHWSFPRSTKI